MKIETVKVSRRFYCDNGVEESIEVEARPVIGANFDKVAAQLRAALDDCGNAPTLDMLEDLRGDIEIAKGELSEVLQQLRDARASLFDAHEYLVQKGIDFVEIRRLLALDEDESESE